jgi:hypothetical protein
MFALALAGVALEGSRPDIQKEPPCQSHSSGERVSFCLTISTIVGFRKGFLFQKFRVTMLGLSATMKK